MKLLKFPMGCLSSRSTIAPSERVEQQQQSGQKTKISFRHTEQSNPLKANGHLNNTRRNGNHSSNNIALSQQRDTTMKSSAEQGNIDRHSINSSMEAPDDDIMSILMIDRDNNLGRGSLRQPSEKDKAFNGEINESTRNKKEGMPRGIGGRMAEAMGELTNGKSNSQGHSIEIEGDQSVISAKKPEAEGSFDEDLNIDLLRQYVAVDYEITQLEDKDALRVYHEKIEQLEQLERELDMISSEAEEVAVRSDSDAQLLDRLQSPGAMEGQHNDSKMDNESNSMLSGSATGSALSHKSWIGANGPITTGGQLQQQQQQQENNHEQQGNNKGGFLPRTPVHHQSGGGKKTGSSTVDSQMMGSLRFNNLSYSTVEEVFNRKIILEKERDKLKKEVEMVIVECDKLQQRYKKRDEILDKLFDGRTGNGLENHLEQQLNWLLEQKHYVDQVFYAWKRAETLTSQTCEQFATALEFLKRLPKVDEEEQKLELAKNIGSLLVKSRQDMEQAQKYNPNVDAPFFTDNETERFDKIIETISSNAISPSEYSQILTVIQFAYKRAVSIRMWLEQILQTTIARDSFELAEEYKWIAIQLRKERINLIKSKLEDSPYHSMAQEIHEQMERQQAVVDRRRQNEINRDSGIESETNDIDIEEEIYRLLEMNKSRLEGATATITNHAVVSTGGGGNSAAKQQATQFVSSEQQLKVALNNNNHVQPISSMTAAADSNRDRLMRDRIQKRVKGDQQLHLSQVPTTVPVLPPPPDIMGMNKQSTNSATISEASTNNSMAISQTPTRLRIELDEDARRSLLKQVDLVHIRHRSRIERLRGSNRAKAANVIMNRMQEARETQHQSESG